MGESVGAAYSAPCLPWIAPARILSRFSGMFKSEGFDLNAPDAQGQTFFAQHQRPLSRRRLCRYSGPLGLRTDPALFGTQFLLRRGQGISRPAHREAEAGPKPMLD